MGLIDWWGVFRNSLWIMGLSVMLAAVSYADWWAKERKIRFREAISAPSIWSAFSAGLFLFCTGLSLCSDRWWERALWAAFALWFACDAVISLRRR